MVWNYSEKVKELFMNAINNKENSHIGEMQDPDAVGFHGSLVCGDAIKLTFKVKKDESNPEKDIITEVRYLTFGCTSAIAASEAICIILEKNKYTPLRALSLTKDDVIKFLNGLPTQKIHCSIMSIEALYAAIYDWAEKRKVDLTKHGFKIPYEKTAESADDRIVCKCMNMTRGYIIDQIKDLNLKTVDEVVDTIKAGSVCGSCIEEEGGIKDILDEIYGGKKVEPKVEGKTPYQIAKEIERVLESDVMPILEKDGGGLEIIDIRGTNLYFRLKGACRSCVSASNTIEYTVQKILRDKVDKNVKVIHVD